MKRLLICLFAFVVGALNRSEAACVIHGNVIDAVSRTPLPKTQVFAKPGAASSKAAILRVSDEQGSFCFDQLESGNYYLLADRSGFLHFVYGAKLGDNNGILLKVEGNTELAALTIVMLPASSISGTVLHGNGEPMENAEVQLWRKIWDHGWKSDDFRGATTDDRGAFSFPLIPPGSYYLSAQPPESKNRETFDEKGQPVRAVEVRTFHAASLTFERATPVVLTTGQDLANLTVKISNAIARRLSGKLSLSAKTTLAGEPEVRIRSDGQSNMWFSVRPDGTFSVEGLLPTRYKLYVEGAEGFQSGVSRDVDLTVGDIEGLLIEPETAFDLHLRARTEGQAGPLGIPMLVREVNTAFRKNARPEADGSYSYKAIPVGVYRVEVDRKDLFLKTIVIDGKGTPSNLIELRAEQVGQIEAVFSPKMARIEGRLESVPEKMSSLAATLIVMGETKSRAEASWVTGPIDHTGGFKLESLPPGMYRVFAIEGFDDQLWGSPELVVLLSSKSVVIELHEDEIKKLAIPFTSAEEWTAALRRIGLE